MHIPAEFGGQTITFVTVSASGPVGFGGLQEDARTETPVEGCRFRPVTTTEDGGTGLSTTVSTGVSAGVWKATCPPVPTVLNAEPNGEVIVDGVTYRIEGPVMPKPDMYGSLHHVTVMCRKQETGA